MGGKRYFGASPIRTLPPFPSLRHFLNWSAETQQFQRIADPVALRHQMTAVHRNVLEAAGPVLQFDAPVLASGALSKLPVVVNLFGATARVAAGLGVEEAGLDDLGAFLAAFRSPAPPDGLRDALSRWPMLKAALATRVRTVNSAPVQQVVHAGDQVDLHALPVQTHWPGDAAPLITWPVVITRPYQSEASTVNAYNAGVTGRRCWENRS